MTSEEHKKLLNEILNNLDNQATVSEKLTQLSEDYTNILTENATLTTSNSELNEKNKELLETNMKLFLKVGSEEKKEEQEQENETPSFEDLFDDNGNLI